MTPKEKAEELINKFILHTEKYNDDWFGADMVAAKVFALIAAQEIDKELRANLEPNFTKKFWLEVKQELQNLN